MSLCNTLKKKSKSFQRFLLLEEISDASHGCLDHQQEVSVGATPHINLSSVHARWNQEESIDTLKDISLESKDKQLFAVIGPVGCGKVINEKIVDQDILG